MEAATDPSVIGRGLIATALRLVSHRHQGTLFFAAGTGDSACRDRNPFDRERMQLEAALEHCRLGDLRLVYCSSAGAIYGDFLGPRDEQTPCQPTSPYGAHKLVCESLIRTSNIRHLILRISNLVGLGANPGQLVPNLVQQILSGVVRIDRSACRDLLDIDDFREIVSELLDHGDDHETVVVASGISVDAHEMATAIQSILNLAAAELPRDAGIPQRFHTEKLRCLAPHSVQFQDEYPLSVLKNHVPAIARQFLRLRPSA